MNLFGINFRIGGPLVPFLSLIFLFNAEAQSDSLINFTGHIYNSLTKEPVMGRVTYEKLPFGDDYGIANSDTSGKFEMVVINKKKYSFMVRAEGFVNYKEIISIEESFTKDTITIQKDFFLTPGGIGQLIRIKNLYFDQSTSNIPESAFGELNGIIQMLTENPKMVIQLEGHTDFRGNSKLNYQLSEERVEAIRSYFERKGIDRRRVKVKAFGGSMPLSKEDSEEARKANRRVEVRVLEI